MQRFCRRFATPLDRLLIGPVLLITEPPLADRVTADALYCKFASPAVSEATLSFHHHCQAADANGVGTRRSDLAMNLIVFQNGLMQWPDCGPTAHPQVSIAHARQPKARSVSHMGITWAISASFTR